MMHYQQLLSKFRDPGIGSSLLRGTVGAMAVRILGTGMAFVGHAILSNLLGVDAFGRYVYVLGWMTILAVVGKLGLDVVSLRFIPTYRVNAQWSLLHGFYRRTGELVLAASVATVLLAVPVVWVLHHGDPHVLRWTFVLAAPLMVIYAALHLRCAQLRSLKRVVIGEAPMLVFRPGLVACGVVAIYFLLPGMLTAPTAMLVNLVATTIVLLFAAAKLRAALPGEALTHRPEYQTSQWIQVAIPLMLSSGFMQILNRTDVVMSGVLLGASQAGIYAVASQVATLVQLGSVAVNAIAAPMISELHAAQSKVQLQRMVTFAAWGIFALAIPATVFLLFTRQWVLSWFGPEFPTGHVALIILCLGQVINALAGSVGTLMILTGHQNTAMHVFGISAGLNIILNAVLIPRFGIEGAAAATATTTILWNVTMVVFVLRRVGINPTIVPLRGQTR